MGWPTATVIIALLTAVCVCYGIWAEHREEK